MQKKKELKIEKRQVQHNDYQKEFETFSANTQVSARFIGYYAELHRQAQLPENLEALNQNPRFWLDYRYMTLESAFIAFGRIFGSPEDKFGNESHCIDRLMICAKRTDFFSSENLRKRKIKDSPNHAEWLEEYMCKAHILGAGDWLEMQKYVDEIKRLWSRVKPIRNKIYAHAEVLDNEKKEAYLREISPTKLLELSSHLQILERILRQAEQNGAKPDYSFCSLFSFEIAKGELKGLLELIKRARVSL